MSVERAKEVPGLLVDGNLHIDAGHRTTADKLKSQHVCPDCKGVGDPDCDLCGGTGVYPPPPKTVWRGRARRSQE